MRKLINKKGFSLVELMIVVVIMGILIAVAIPLYGGIQDRAKRNTCRNNQRDVRAVFAKWVLESEENNADTLFKTGTSFNGSTQDASEVINESFLAGFSEGKLPECPEDGHYYVITKVAQTQISVKCVSDGVVDEDHEVD